MKILGFIVSSPREIDFYKKIWEKNYFENFDIIVDDHIDRHNSIEGYRLTMSILDNIKNENADFSRKHVNIVMLSQTISDNVHVRGGGGYFIVVATKDFNKWSRVYQRKSLRKYLGKLVAKLNASLISSRGFISGYNTQSLNIHSPNQLGIHRVMFPRGIDLSNKEPEDSSISFFNHFFCHGRFDSKIYSSETPHDTTIIGYPRYDGFRRQCNESRAELDKEFDLSPNKPYVIWMSGQYETSTRLWMDALLPLLSRFNVICRPHPKQTAQNPRLINQLSEKGYKVDAVTSRSLVNLYSAADFVLADWGDSIFGSLYCGVKTIMLNLEPYDASRDRHGLKKIVRNNLPNFNPDHESCLEMKNIMEDKVQWPRLERQVDEIANDLFGKRQGRSVETVLAALKEMKQEHKAT